MSEKEVISRELFDKKVDIERAHLMWIERMLESEARAEAVKRVSAEFKVER